eukprot:3568715-Pyramimonas_sp.AAC.1
MHVGPAAARRSRHPAMPSRPSRPDSATLQFRSPTSSAGAPPRPRSHSRPSRIRSALRSRSVRPPAYP